MKSISQNIDFKNPNQILNMGGPWVGEMFYNGKQVTDNVIIDNILFEEGLNRLFFVKFNEQSKWKNDNYFTINYFDLSTYNVFKYESKFESIFISSISDNGELLYYEAFHDKNKETKKKINLKDL